MRRHQQHKPFARGVNRQGPDLKSILDGAEKALFDAAANGFVNVVRDAILHHADMEVRNSKKQTALIVAAAGGHMNVVEALERLDANPFALDEDNLTARERAKNAGHSHIASALEVYEEKWKKEHEDPEYISSD